MKTLYGKRALKLVSLLLLIVLAVLFLQEYIFRDYWQFGQGSLRIKGFYREPKQTLDVVLIGDSTVYAGYAPGYAYKTQGITSYNMAIGANVCTTWRPITEEILRRQDPQLIVVDIGGIQYDSLQEKFDSSTTFHALTDNMPWSANRAAVIRDIIVGRYGGDALEYWFPLSRYHNDWSSFGELLPRAKELLAWQFGSRNVLKGTVARVSAEPVQSQTIDVRRDDTTMELAPESETVLREYLEYCRENDRNVVFISVPCRIREDDESLTVFRRENRAGEIVREYGFDYWNFHHFTDEIGLDPERDFYNDAHLNYHGQIKFTEYLSRFFVEEYGVKPAALTGSQRAAWDRSADYIERFYAFLATQPGTEEDPFSERVEVMTALDAMGPQP